MESEISLENWSERREEGVGGGGETKETSRDNRSKLSPAEGRWKELIRIRGRLAWIKFRIQASSRINRSGTVVPRFDNIRVGFSLRFFPRVSFSYACSTNEIPPGTRNYRGDKIFQG